MALALLHLECEREVREHLHLHLRPRPFNNAGFPRQFLVCAEVSDRLDETLQYALLALERGPPVWRPFEYVASDSDCIQVPILRNLRQDVDQEFGRAYNEALRCVGPQALPRPVAEAVLTGLFDNYAPLRLPLARSHLVIRYAARHDWLPVRYGLWQRGPSPY